MIQQTVENQKAEVEFRRKVAQTQSLHNQLENADSLELEKLLQARMQKTRNQMLAFKKKQIAISPYIELGAERCQRSLIMENDLEAHGASVDISFESLKNCEVFSKKYKKPILPTRICCDANNLPFKTNSIPFVFCYQTLHHFPDVYTVIRQIHRVLTPNGHFYFDEEPYKTTLHLNLYEKALFKKRPLLKSAKMQDVLDLFLSKREIDAGEEAGILENYNTTLNEWKAALNMFEKTELKLESYLTKKTVFAFKEIHHLTGSTITGLCQKKSDGKDSQVKPLMHNLICPTCLQQGTEAKLTQNNNMLTCDRCGDKYPIVKGVLILFTKSKLRELYPEIIEEKSLNALTESIV
jgi:ubiquinone/menaquinone biosynthesis C-methylase UbiE/uncharacterized protein YbaR (Trm112 family)